MTVKNKTLKTPITYYGGKQSLLKHILPLIPGHVCYTEAFVGGAAVYFAKGPSDIEVINDVNSNLVNFYRVFKTRYKELKAKIDLTLHSRDMHELAGMIYDHPFFFEPVERAWAVWVLSKMSFASKLDGSFGYDKTKNGVPKKITNAKEAFNESLSKRLEHTQIECTDALRIIKSRDTINAFHFVDPPYIGTDCGHYSNYNLMDFQNLLELLSQLEGKFMLTMFPHEMLTDFIQKNGWKVVEVSRHISASKVKRRKQTELIVMNY